MNIFRLTLLLGILIGIFLGIGYYFGGIPGMTLALILALLFNFAAYWYSDKIVLTIYRAKPLKDERIESIVRKLCKNANLPIPKLYVVENEQPNAFATGRNKKHASIAVTRGLLELLEEDEIEGVLSHELAHIKNRDMLVSTIAATIAAAISYIAEMLWWSSLFGDRERPVWTIIPVIILAPIAATLVQLAISRSREYLADYTGALLCDKPLALANALRKIASYAKHAPLHGPAATSHLWIVNPFKGDILIKLFSTHPPVEERVKRLEELAKKEL